MKILLLADPISSHVIKWANGLSSSGITVGIFGLSRYYKDQYKQGIEIEIIDFADSVKLKSDGHFSKLAYLKALPKLKKFIQSFNPDIIHAHSASSYGFLGALSRFHPYFVSVWGNDVYTFPRKSIFTKLILRYNLSQADQIFSTSNIMAKETKKYTSKKILVIPFGVDTSIFKPEKIRKYFSEKDIVIGTVKSLEPKYGIIDLIKAFKILKHNLPNIPLKLLIIGTGSQESNIINYLQESKLQHDAIVTGFVKFSEIPEMHNNLDIMVSVSVEDSESFGVSVIEASACAKPVVVSSVGGLPEVVDDGITGVILPKNRPDLLSQELEKLVLDIKLRERYGQAGRERVIKLFSFNDNLLEMIENYKKFIKYN